MLLMEIRFTSVDEDQRISLAIIAREVQLLEPWWSVLMMFAGGKLIAGGGRRGVLRVVEALDCKGVGLNRGLERLEGGGQGVQRRLKSVGVAYGGVRAWRRWSRGRMGRQLW